MTKAPVQPFGERLTTKSGNPITLGTGTGTKWQKIKKARDASLKDTLVEEMVDYLVESVKNGYRHIDTAEIYTTHPEVAQAIAKCGVPREELFITTKYNPGTGDQPSPHGTGAKSVDAALTDLNLEYIDLFLIHFPFFELDPNNNETIETVWEDLIAAKKAGKVRYIGVSNFTSEHLERLFKVAGGDQEFYPKVNQIEFHPYLQNQSPGIIEFCKNHGILVEAYGPLSPLFRIEKDGEEAKDHPLKRILPKLVEKYGKTDSQILLRYTLQIGLLPITTSSQSQRQREALDVYNFQLDDEDVETITTEGAKFSLRNFFQTLF